MKQKTECFKLIYNYEQQLTLGVMKAILSIILLSFMLMATSEASAQKKNKKERQMEQFAETQKLIDSRQFIFVPDRAFPQGGRSIDLTTNYGFIKIMGEETVGDMPFFGRGFTVPYGGDGGIKFDKTAIENEQVQVNEKKLRTIYSFEAKSKDDHYRISIDIGYSGNASVNVTCNNRSPISYNGQISKIEDDKNK